MKAMVETKDTMAGMVVRMCLGALVLTAIGLSLVILVAVTAHAQAELYPLDKEGYLISELTGGSVADGVLSLHVPTRLSSYSRKAAFDLPVKASFKLAGFVPPPDYDKLVSPTYRTVEYLYDGYGSTPSGIVEVLEDGTTKLICNITVEYKIWHDENGEPITEIGMVYLTYIDRGMTVTLYGEPNWTNLLFSASINEGVYYGLGAGGTITKVYNEYDSNGNRTFGIMKTTYFDREGNKYREDVTKERSYYNTNGQLVSRSASLEIDGKLVWVKTQTNIYSNGRLFIEIRNELDYNSDGTVISSRMERTMYDREGREMTYDLRVYDRNVLTYSLRRTTERSAAGDITNFVREERRYNSDGSLISQNSEVMKFDSDTGDYFHSVSSITYDGNGNITNSTQTKDTEIYSDGKLVMKRHFYQTQTRPAWGPFQGQLITTHEEETITEYTYDSDGDLIKEYEHGYWFTVYVDPFFEKVTDFVYSVINGMKKLMSKTISRVEAVDAEFQNVTSRYSYELTYGYDDQGAMTSMTVKVCSETYNGSGEIASRTFTEDNEEYVNGRLVSKRHFNQIQSRPGWGPFQGQLTVTHEEETITEYTYDEDGDLIKEYEHGYWFNVYVDPFFEKITSFFYDLINGVKKLIGKTVFRREAVDADYRIMISEYSEETSYIYDDATGELRNVSTVITEKTFSNGVLISIKDVFIDELYENGNIVCSTRVESINGVVNYIETVTYERYADGSIASKIIHKEWLYNGAICSTYDEVVRYDTSGRLTLHSIVDGGVQTYLETREYYDNGTLRYLSITSDRPTFYRYGRPIYYKEVAVEYDYGMPQGHYELREAYNKDGKITHREEVRETSGGRWPCCGWYIGWWGGYSYTTTTKLTEDWKYAPNGTLTHYKKEYSSTTTYSRWGWYDEWDWKRYPSEYRETVERFYDPSTGKLTKESYFISGTLGGIYVPEKMREERLNGIGTADIPEDVNAFIGSVIDSLYGSTASGVNNEMSIAYNYNEAGVLMSVNISWTQSSVGGTNYTYFCTINVENGKIKDLVVSESGEKSPGGKIEIIYPIKVPIEYRDEPIEVVETAVEPVMRAYKTEENEYGQKIELETTARALARDRLCGELAAKPAVLQEH